MIFKIYIALFVLAILILMIGYFSKPNIDVLKIVGYGFIFMLGIMLIDSSFFGSVELCNNNLINFTENTQPDNSTLRLNNYQNVCEDYDNKTFGFYIAVLGGLGFASVFLQIRSRRWEEQ